MRADPFSAIINPILGLLHQALPKDLAASVGAQIEAKIQESFKHMALVPKHEFEAQTALLATLEAQIAHLETRLASLEGTDRDAPAEQPKIP
jgi:BMFP domain-containing protein YqiC